MSEDMLDTRLHALLDGRLSVEERRELEARLRDDPELAARLESYRAIGEGLREGDSSLPAGFYSRARARFEAQTGGAAADRRQWFRPVSWESLGVAAAAVLALAIFLPQWNNGNSPLQPDTVSTTAGRSGAVGDLSLRAEVAENESAAESADSLPGTRTAGKAVVDDRLVERQEDDESARSEETVPADAPAQDKRKPAAPPAEHRAPSPAAPPPPPGKPAKETLAAEPRSRANEGAGVRQDADEPESTFRQFALNDASTDAVDTAPAPLQQSFADEVKAEDDATATEPDVQREEELAELLNLAKTAEPFSTFALRMPLVERGEVLVLDDTAALRRAQEARQAAGLRNEAHAATAPAKGDSAETKDEKKAQRKKDKTRVRWVLIGPRDKPFACGGFKISSEGDVWVIGLSAPSADQEPTIHGCVLTLPPDAKTVRVTGP